MSDKDEYELIPVSPIRHLEKRMERLEESSPVNTSKDVFKDMLEIIRMNQQIVDELAKSNDALRIEVSKLPAKIEELVVNLKELISFIKSSGEDEAVGVTQESMKPVVDKLDELIKANKSTTEKDESILELLDTISKRMRRPPQIARKQLLHQPMKPLKARNI